MPLSQFFWSITINRSIDRYPIISWFYYIHRYTIQQLYNRLYQLAINTNLYSQHPGQYWQQSNSFPSASISLSVYRLFCFINANAANSLSYSSKKSQTYTKLNCDLFCFIGKYFGIAPVAPGFGLLTFLVDYRSLCASTAC